MSTSEYLPSENEPTALTVHEAQELQPAKEFIRIQCFGCTTEVGCTGTRESVFRLLEFNGWKVGAKILCPDCVQKSARKFFQRYRE